MYPGALLLQPYAPESMCRNCISWPQIKKAALVDEHVAQALPFMRVPPETRMSRIRLLIKPFLFVRQGSETKQPILLWQPLGLTSLLPFERRQAVAKGRIRPEFFARRLRRRYVPQPGRDGYGQRDSWQRAWNRRQCRRASKPAQSLYLLEFEPTYGL